MAVLAALLLSLALTPVAHAGTTAASSLTKSGVDPTTGDTASSASGHVGQTRPGDTITWAVNYRNLTGSSADVTMTNPIGAGQTYVPGSLKLPPGFDGRWSTNGGATYVTTEPGSGVDAVGAVGSGIDRSTGTQAGFPAGSTSFNGGNGGGDGYEALFWNGNVYNIHHHADTSTIPLLDCHVEATGAECPGFAGGGVFISQTAGTPFSTSTAGTTPFLTTLNVSAAEDLTTGKVYVPVGIKNDTSWGILCLDLANSQSCGFHKQGDAAFSQPDGTNVGVSGGDKVGTKIYDMDEDAVVHCYDFAAGADCGTVAAFPGYTFPNTVTSHVDPSQSRVKAYGNLVFVLHRRAETNTNFLSCIDTTTLTRCSGYPIAGAVSTFGVEDNLSLAPKLSTTGTLTGICALDAIALDTAPYTCFDLSGAPTSNPYPQLEPGTVGLAGIGDPVVRQTKVYLPYYASNGNTQYGCYDFATGAACTGFAHPVSNGVQPYTLRDDPFNPGCIWEVGNAGIFQVIDATTGALTCNQKTATTQATPAASYCDGQPGHVTGWDALTLSGITSADYTEAIVSLTDADGNAVPGWTDRSFPSTQQAIDISQIPATGATATLHVALTIRNPSGSATPTMQLTWHGDPVQVCFQTKVADPGCTVAPTAVPDPAVAVTTGDNGVTDGPAGNSSGTAAFSIPAQPQDCHYDVSLSKAADRSVLAPGDPVTFTVVATNHGPDTAPDQRVTDTLPARLHPTSATTSAGGCTIAGQVVTCAVGNIPAGGAVTVTVHATAASTGAALNVASVHAAPGLPADGDPGNDTATALVQVTGLSISKVAARTRVHDGQRLGFRIRVHNSSAVALSNVRVCDRLPSKLAYVSSSPRASLRGGQYCWTVSSLAAHASRLFRITTRAVAGSGHARNTASATAANTRRATARRTVRVLPALRRRPSPVTG